MSGVMTALSLLNLVLVIAFAGGFAVMVIALWRISRALQSIATGVQVLVAHALMQQTERREP